MNWINYLFQTNLYLLCFYILYRLAFSKETYFNLNRVYLICFTILSFFIPFWQSGVVQSWFITQQVSQQIYTSGLDEIIISAAPITNTKSFFSFYDWLSFGYIMGVIYMTVVFCSQLFNLQRFLHSKTTKGLASSFFGKIKVDKTLPHLDVIMAHEKVHGAQQHSIDLILISVVKIICWFNPVVYLLNIELKKIHEFIADQKAAAHLGSKAAYAQILISNQFSTSSHALIHNFFEKATVKTRLKMLLKKKSTKTAMFKYGMIAPAFVTTLILASSFVPANSQQLLSTQEDLRSSFTLSSIFTQDIDVQGIVANENKNPLPGASIKIVGTDRVTTTDVNGKFSITDVEKDAVLQISFIGFEPVEVVAQGNLSVTLSPSTFILEDIVVAGYKGMMPQFDSNVIADISLERKPEYPGGTNELYRFIGSNLSYPAYARQNDIQGKVIVSFTIDNDGTAKKPVVIQGLGYGCDEEVMRIVNMMPKWKPARQNGEATSVNYQMPVEFKLEQGTESSISKIPNSFPQKPIIYTAVEESPEFIGGVGKLYDFIGKNLKYPAQAIENKAEGRVFVRFVVRDNGEVDDIKILKGIGHGCEDEAKRVLKMMPKWRPGYQNGQAVNVYFTMPIVFRLNDAAPKKTKLDGAMIIIDGKVSDKATAENIAPDRIQNVNILKGEEAINRYGEQAKNGAVVIELKNNNTTRNIPYSRETANSSLSKSGKNKPIFVVDGKVMDKKTFEASSIDPDDIASINVLKGEQAVNAYGKKGIDGVVLVELKSGKSKSTQSLYDDSKVAWDVTEPMFYVNDKLINKSTFEKSIKPERIKSMTFLKGKKAIEKHGAKGKNGVIEVELNK